jgi:(p)ppGpp synthase/HD superfamily hydrolase
MIEVIFSEKVASKVDDLTRIKLHGKISSAEMIESLYILGKHDVLMIKIFDRIHNMQTIGVKSPEKIKKIVHETTSTFLALATHFDSLDIEKKTTDLCLLKSKNNQSSFYKQKKFSFF